MIGDVLYYILYGSCINTTLLIGVVLFLIKIPSPLNNKIIALKKVVATIYFFVTAGISITLFSPHMQPLSAALVPLFVMVQVLLARWSLCILFHSELFSKGIFLRYVMPFVLLAAAEAVLHLPEEIGFCSVDGCMTSSKRPEGVVRLLLFAASSIYIILCLRYYVKSRSSYLQNESDAEMRLDVDGVGRILVLFLSWDFMYLVLSFLDSYCGNLVFLCITTLFYFILGLHFLKFGQEADVSEQRAETAKMEDNFLAVSEQKIVDWIEKKGYVQSGIVIADVADATGIPAKKLSCYIRSSYDNNFNVWLNTLRIEEAKRIMEHEWTVSVTEISEMVGFSDRSHFSRQFKQITGETAVSYQKKFRKKSEPFEK